MSDELLARWLARAAAVATPSLRLGLWVESLTAYPPARGAELLQYVARRVRVDESAKAVYLPLLDRRSLLDRVGGARLHELLEEAHAAGFTACGLLLFTGKAARTEEAAPANDPVTEQLSLGHRKTLARGTRNPMMERLLKSLDPEVVRETLRNPRLREAEVVAIASRRPAPEGVFTHLGAAPQWLARPAVQRAVVRNPYAPPSLAAGLLVCLPAQVLREVHRDKKLHPAVRDGAFEVLSWELGED